MSREAYLREQTGINGFAGVGQRIAGDWVHSSRYMAGRLPKQDLEKDSCLKASKQNNAESARSVCVH